MKDLIWVEKYRPKTIFETILDEETKAIFQGYVDSGNVPNLFLYGPPGTGKTTSAMAMLKEIEADYILINASLDRSIDILRNEIAQYASSISFAGGRKYIIMDEADNLRMDVQQALRGFMEMYNENCFHKDTKILTLEYGPIEFQKIVGQTVTVKSKDGIWRPAKVKSYGKQKLFKYKFGKFNSSLNHYHQEVIATENHKWFLEDNSITTNLSVGDKLLDAPLPTNKKNIKGIIHGMIFGDGTGHKTYNQDTLIISTQGSKYASIRLCKKDSVQEEMYNYLIEDGYIPTYPKHAHGDPIFQLGFIPHVKDLPFTYDPEYIEGFIYGWWLADGKKTHREKLIISTINSEAIEWLKDHASIAGYRVTGLNCRENGGTGCYPNAKPCYNITLSHAYAPVLRHKEYYGEEEVYCVEEPITKGFVLANGLLTGNCGFILTANYPNKVIEALRESRCVPIRFNPSEKLAIKFFKRVITILENENIKYNKEVVGQLVLKRFPDQRRILNELQAYSKSGEIDVGILVDTLDEEFSKLVEFMKKKNFSETRKWIAENKSIQTNDLYRKFYDSASQLMTKESIPELILILAKYQYQASFVADHELNNAACFAEIMGICDFK